MSEFVGKRNVGGQIIFHGNSDIEAIVFHRCLCRKGAVGWEMIHHLHGRVDVFEMWRDWNERIG